MLDISLLGTSGMMPLPNRWLTSMAVRYSGKMILVDCGEGTQITLKMQGWGFKAIELICFTHYHADHISGLPGILLAIGNSGRVEPVTLIGPFGLKKVVEGLRVIAPDLPFEIQYIEIPFDKEIEVRQNGYILSALPVDHLIPCMAYRIDVPRKGKFDPIKAKSNNIPQRFWRYLQNSETVEDGGVIYTPDMALGKSRRGLRITYCTDTRPTKNIEDFAKASDLFICEGMYGEDDKKDKAVQNKHMLFSEAATLASRANVAELWLTHFSPSLTKPEEFLSVAKDIFANTIIGYDRISKVLYFNDEDKVK
jgi:ribonuclease Z